MERDGDAPAPDADDGSLTRAVTTAVLSCSGVTRLCGPAGRRTRGVRLRADALDVHVVGRYGPTIEEITAEVRAAVTPLVPGRAVRVLVEDLEVQHGTAASGAADSGRPSAAEDAARREEFRAFVRTHHPDVGGDPAVFRAGLAAFREEQRDPNRAHRSASGSERVYIHHRRGPLLLLVHWVLDRFRPPDPPRGR